MRLGPLCRLFASGFCFVFFSSRRRHTRCLRLEFRRVLFRSVGQWAEEAKSLVTNGIVPKGLVVDLTDVSYVDSVGEKVLTWLASVGASFMAKTVYAASVCERLQLPVHRKAPVCSEQF